MNYRINKQGRWVSAQIEYHTVDWNSFDAVADTFETRLREWYIEPAILLRETSGHFAFPVMALNCILLDTLSQFVKGSGRANFKAFVSERIPEFGATMPLTILHVDSQCKVKLKTFADALYHAFRCGILHEAHVAAYGMVRGNGNLVDQVASGFTYYPDNTDCPTVIIDPWQLLDRVKDVLTSYVAQLKDTNPKFDALRLSFKKRFTESFGVDITGAQ